MPVKFEMHSMDLNDDDKLPVKKNWSGLVLRHVCESCGKDEVLDVEQAYNEGWDYPPKFGPFGIIMPRTCGDCSITQTLWWDLVVTQSADINNLNEHQKEVLNRILSEPQSLYVPETDLSMIYDDNKLQEKDDD